MFVRGRLIATLRRLAKLTKRSDQAARADALLAIAKRVAKSPEEAARQTLGLYEGRETSFDRLVLTHDGRALAQSKREWREALEFARLRWTAYELAVRLWHRTKRVSPLSDIEDGAPVQRVADYGGGNEVWRKGRSYILRVDVGSHMSLWRDWNISRKDAEQAVLGYVHFHYLVIRLQCSLSKRGLAPNQGSFKPLPDPS